VIELLFIVGSILVRRNWLTVLFGFIVSIIIRIISFDDGWYIDGFFCYSTISRLLVFLRILLCALSLIATPEDYKSFPYKLCLRSLCFLLILVFSRSNLFIFYIFFEATLIPTLFLIVGWGAQPERLQAGTYIILYTVGASLPLLLLILWYCFNIRTIEVRLLHLVSTGRWGFSGLMVLVLYGAFLAKLPIYGVHLWLPKAHVEAPLAGSMVLAGILLKLGGYGLLQINFCFNISIDRYTRVLICLTMWGGFLATIICLRQSDVKSLVAYSSVGHIRIVAAGIIIDTSWGLTSAIITIMAHGFCSPGIFCIAFFSYKKSHTRNIPYIKGILQVYPLLRLRWFILCCVNIACPPTLNLIGELCIVPVLWNSSLGLAMVIGLMVFFSASYNIYLYICINHGRFSPYLQAGSPIEGYIFVVLSCHALTLIFTFRRLFFSSYSNLIVILF